VVNDYPNEYIISVECTYDIEIKSEQRLVRSVMFKTSKGKTSKVFGRPSAEKFVLENNGSALVGFHGGFNYGLEVLGAYFSPLIPSPPPPPSAEKLQLEGGEAVGDPWDDGVFNGVREVHLEDGESIALKFVYDKDVQVTELKVHGEPSGIGFNEVIIYSFTYLL